VGLNKFLHDTISRTNPEQALMAKLQEFGNAGDFPAQSQLIIDKFKETPTSDEAWRMIYDVRDFTGSNRGSFTIVDVQDGLTFSKVPTGDKAHVYGMSGTKSTVYFDKYGAGLQWDRTLFDDAEYWTLEDNAISFRNQALYNRSYNHYALIEAVNASQNMAWQACVPAALATSDATYTANRDAQTLNAAAVKIFDDCKNLGFGMNPQTPLVVLVPYQLQGRIRMALNLLLQAVTTSAQMAAFNFVLVPTIMLSVATAYYVILPKQKIKSGIRMELTMLSEVDALSYSDLTVGWMRYGAGIGEIKQFQRCAIS